MAPTAVRRWWLRSYVITGCLFLAAIFGFFGVNRIVNRFREQEKALARHLYEEGQLDQRSGNMQRAIEDYRAALTYSPDDFQYQLSLARTLRDSGRTGEAKSYLKLLWERSPEDGPVNLALGRLAGREGSINDAIHYYHNAIYGVWASEPEVNRRNAQFELIEFLLKREAVLPAQAELISLTSTLPSDPALHLQLAQLFAQDQDYQHAIGEYEKVLKQESKNSDALTGAGEAAFKLARYPAASQYLTAAVRVGARDPAAAKLLETSNLILEADPLERGLPVAERRRRIQTDFVQAGKRMDECAASKGIDLNVSTQPLSDLKSRWLQMKPRVMNGASREDTEAAEAAMDLTFQAEKKTDEICGHPTGLDEALLLLASDHSGADK
ncbi:MAG: tetratricopeptide repeat protein [Acidobacteriales bacterium]|nr:tetratricopeptide repeat protein [Terriglobales bacterium]